MRQVFFTTNAALATTTGVGLDRFTDAANAQVGFWNLDVATGGAWVGTSLYQSLVDDGGGAGVAVARALPLYRQFQIVQGFTTNNPLATPIINADKLVRITTGGYDISVRHALTIAPTANENDESCNLRIIIRTTPTDYVSYVNNEVDIADLSGDGYQFPLGQFNTTNHKIMNIAFEGGTAVADTVDNFVTAIQNNPTFNSMFTVVDNGNDATLTARHAGVVFEAILMNLSTATPSAATETPQAVAASWKPGIGNDWQARGDELRARTASANYNRMYFPQSYTDFAIDGKFYNRFEITYKIDGDRDVVKGSQFGTAIIYEENSNAVVNPVLGTPVAGATTEILF